MHQICAAIEVHAPSADVAASLFCEQALPRLASDPSQDAPVAVRTGEVKPSRMYLVSEGFPECYAVEFVADVDGTLPLGSAADLLFFWLDEKFPPSRFPHFVVNT